MFLPRRFSVQPLYTGVRGRSLLAPRQSKPTVGIVHAWLFQFTPRVCVIYYGLLNMRNIFNARYITPCVFASVMRDILRPICVIYFHPCVCHCDVYMRDILPLTFCFFKDLDKSCKNKTFNFKYFLYYVGNANCLCTIS